jgi:glycogen synthase
VYAGSDLLLSPSTFEPCGLGPLIGLRYGAIPVVRKTGGLADTIPDFTDDPRRGLGFTFTERTPSSLLAAIRRALAVYRDVPGWRSLLARAMAADYSWDNSAREYERLYRRALAGRRTTLTGGNR